MEVSLMVEPFLDTFNKLKKILCLCPECQYIMRLSDLHLRSTGAAPKTWLDDYEFDKNKVEQKEDKFDQEKQKIKEDATARGRLQVQKIVKKSLDENFAKLNFNPYDVKPLNHPIDFVVFNGNHNKDLKDVTLLTYKNTNPNLEKLHQGIAKAIEQKEYDWKVVRISNDGKVEYE